MQDMGIVNTTTACLGYTATHHFWYAVYTTIYALQHAIYALQHTMRKIQVRVMLHANKQVVKIYSKVLQKGSPGGTACCACWGTWTCRCGPIAPARSP